MRRLLLAACLLLVCVLPASAFFRQFLDFLARPGKPVRASTSSTTLPGCDTPGDTCTANCVGGGGGFCLQALPGDTPNVCVVGDFCDLVTCASSADCSGGKGCYDGGGGITACCPPCIPVPPCNTDVWCDLCPDGAAEGGRNPCVDNTDCNPGYECHDNLHGEAGCMKHL